MGGFGVWAFGLNFGMEARLGHRIMVMTVCAKCEI